MILEIIQKQCLPQRNCMLTVVSDRGETGFLYFKDAQLIEVNLGAKWGQEAFTTIYHWKVVRFSIGELPAGIKRTIWDLIERMVEIAKKSPPPEIMASGKSGYAARFQVLPGFAALYEEENGKLYRVAGRSHESSQPVFEFIPSILELGRLLGAGILKNFYVRTPQFQGWRVHVSQEKKDVFIFADASADAFEAKMREIL